MYFASYCILFGILVFPLETNGASLTWLKPMPVQVVSSTNRVEHQNQTRLIEGTINASLIWHFELSSELTFVSLNLQLNGAAIASETGVFTQFRDKYAVNLVQSSEIIVTLVIFEVTAAHDTIFSCEVFAREQAVLSWKSNVQVDVFGPPRTILTSSGQITRAPAVLTLNCSADAKPTPTIFWTRVSDSTVVTMPLNITGVEDGGSYRCTADNGFGKRLTKDVFVDVQFPPMVRVPSKVVVERKQTAFLFCEVEGNPTPIMSWSPCPEKSVCDERYLNISKVQTARANYTCTATNALGVDSAATVVLIGGKNVYLSLSVSGECDNKDSVWKILQKELLRVFANTQSYCGAQLIQASCGSLILNVVLKFSTEVAEDDTISIIQNAFVDGKLGEFSVNVSYISGIPAVEQTKLTVPTSTTPKSNEIKCICSDNEITLLVIIGVLGIVIIVLTAVIIWQQRKLRAIGNKRACEVPVTRDTGFYDNEVVMKDLNPTYPVSKNSTQQQVPNELTYMPLRGISPTGEGSVSPVSHGPNAEYAPLDVRTRSWEVERIDVKVEKIIGKGAFGQVAKGTAKNLAFKSGATSVAIKMVKANAPESDKRDLKSELELMKTLKPHPHVIKLLGCVTESEPLLVLIEYVPYGDLLGYLRKSRGLNDTYYKDPDIKPKSNLTSQKLMKFAWQIADGMSYLSFRKVVHRDLAARNVLVGERETCKITDFGMARDVQLENIYERKTKGRLPVKWTAYESLLYGKYTTKSDAWSYGVVLYEISTIGGSPYPRMEGRKIANLLQQGYRMPKPEHVDDDLYQIMINCWQCEPDARPSFSDLTQQLKHMENQHKRLINMHIYDNALYANLEDLNA